MSKPKETQSAMHDAGYESETLLSVDKSAPPSVSVELLHEHEELEETLGVESELILAGKYRLDEKLGSGGMGEVFRGEHLLLHTPVAIKVLHPFIAADPQHERRFQHEARAAIMLNHPNVVRVFDYGKHERTSYIVMDYIDGVSLDDWLEARSVLPPLSEVAHILLQVLSAVEAAHSMDIVHRDLKPDNILLTESKAGVVAKVVDFGLAHVEDPADMEPTLTKRDTIAGTPAYMSPEQCRSLAVGPSTDLYAIGCLLTTMLQGRPPFGGSSAMDIVASQMFLPPPALSRPSDIETVPALLERLRRDLLAKEPHARPASAAEVAQRLREAMSPKEHAKRLPSRKGNIPIGAREERTPQWRSETPPQTLIAAETALHVDVFTTGTHPQGWNKNLIAGLAAQGITATIQSNPHLLSKHFQDDESNAVVLDVDDNVDDAVEMLREILADEPHLAVVVCIARLGTERMNRLIEAGATDVLRYPISSDKLARKIRRSVTRQRKTSVR
ncbi:MAG: serine/threonine protein kinase [Sorangium cellulosum]|nr:MAG: serine/threonine protein kinase [Sorangium cellulosum]